MTEILAVFRSRSQAMDCNARLRAYNVPATIINTPQEVGVGCGLSLKIPQGSIGAAQRIIAGGKYPAFYGFYKYDFNRVQVLKFGR